jgi:hypothetical protein
VGAAAALGPGWLAWLEGTTRWAARGGRACVHRDGRAVLRVTAARWGYPSELVVYAVARAYGPYEIWAGNGPKLPHGDDDG